MIKITFEKTICFFMIIFIITPIASSISIDYDDYDPCEENDSIYQSYTFNTPPYPPIIDGPLTVKEGKTYQYTFTLIDPDIDDSFLALEVDFGDEIVQAVKRKCERQWYNGTILEMDHSWHETAEIEIKARVMDSYGEWSNWSSPFKVSISKIKITSFFLQEYFSEFFTLNFKFVLFKLSF